MASHKVDIGYLEETSDWRLHPRFFPSKVGGKPAWLDLKNLPSPQKLICKLCEQPLVFLCQVYAPYEELSECFHRIIFIFICRNGSCYKTNSAENFVVLRCQLPRKNEYFPSEPCPANENEEFSLSEWTKMCELCGNRAPSHCSKCKATYYCSRQHQILDWQKGHKEICPNLQNVEALTLADFKVTNAGKSILFKEWELIVDAEDEEEVKNVDVDEEYDKLRKLMMERKAGSLNEASESELEQYTGKIPKDKVFKKFSKRIARHPDQVLRYDRGGSPLWITGNSKTVLDVPECPYCYGERQFEFQIMPQLLNYLNVGVDLNSIDWGVLAVYTCKVSCIQGPAYKEEFMIKQDLIN